MKTLDQRTLDAAALYERANVAAADALRWSREPGGEGLAAVRRADAIALRALARYNLNPWPERAA